MPMITINGGMIPVNNVMRYPKRCMLPSVHTTEIITTINEKITAEKNLKNKKINKAVTKIDKYVNILISSATLDE